MPGEVLRLKQLLTERCNDVVPKGLNLSRVSVDPIQAKELQIQLLFHLFFVMGGIEPANC
jgi:hypothetical protein